MSMCYWCQRKPYCQEMNRKLYESIDEGKIYCEGFTQDGLPNISMAWTTPAWVTENKEVTRRNWAMPTLRRFKKDATYLAWSKNKMYGGEPIGLGRMTKDAFKESLDKNTVHGMEYFNEFYKAEGFEYLDDRNNEIIGSTTGYRHLHLIAMKWASSNKIMTVVPFKIVEVFPGMKEKYTTDEEIIRCVKALVRALP